LRREMRAMAVAVIAQAMDEVNDRRQCDVCNRGIAAAPRLGGMPHRIYQCTRAWFASGDTGPLTLAWWCGFLGLLPEAVRRTAEQRVAAYNKAQGVTT
jgi:hypothetical protein